MSRILQSLKLKQKIMSIILLGTVIMLCSSFLLLVVVERVYKELLHQTMSDSLSYSSREISNYLKKLEDLSMMLLSDSVIQEHLVSIDESGNQSEIAEDLSRIRSSIGGYYQSYSDGILQYITIYSEKATACTNILRADKTSMERQRQMIETAEQYGGAPVWISDEVKEDGLFLVRRINEISSIRKKSIGTILMKVDMDALISQVVSESAHYNEMAYMIVEHDRLVYSTKNISVNDESLIRELEKRPYTLLKLQDKPFFMVRGEIKDYGWDYYCLVSYQEIQQAMKKVNLISILILMSGVFIIELLAGRITGSLTQHINRMLEKMQQFAKDNTKVPTTDYDYSKRKDELGILHTHFDSMASEMVELIQKNYINEILKQEAQYKALESQINPHFLYNTLDSIKWRAKAAGQEEISKMVEALAVLLRTSLKKHDEKEFSIGNEMEIVNSYIMIQKMRYEERLCFENHISPVYFSKNIPKLTIQPLVENAIAYGLESNIDACEITLLAEVKNKVLYVYVKNTGSEVEEHLLDKLREGEVAPHGHGIGLLNIDKRIKMMFGEDYGLSLYNEEEMAVAQLRFPV